jgi:CheY-like chemotaxis protein
MVTAHSDGPGLGSEFTVRLPAAAPDSNGSAAQSTSGSSQSATNGRGTRVLVVDDHREVADGLKRLLRLLGYDVRAELNPLDAVATAEAFRPEIALLDLGLPTMDGYTLAMELRARLGADAPALIALSGYNQPQDRRRSHAAGFATHLVKPIDVDDLVDALNKFGRTTAAGSR